MTLRDDLRRVADGAPLEPIAMAGVRAKARSIRRRRVGGAVGAAAVGVAAIAAASVLLMPGSADRGDSLPSTRTPSPTRSAVVTPPSDSATALTSIPINLTNPPVEKTTGASLSVPNWMTGALTDAKGNATPISTPVYDAVHDPATGDWFGMTFTQGRWTWTQWSGSGAVVLTRPSPGDRVGITPDGTTWAVMVDGSASSEIWTYRAGTAAPRVTRLTLPQGEPQNGAGVDGILPNGDVVFDAAPGDLRVAHADGTATKVPGGYLGALAVEQDGTIVAQQAGHGGDECYSFTTATGSTDGSGCFGPGSGSLSSSADGRLWAYTIDEGTVHVALQEVPGSAVGKGPQLVDFAFPQGAVVDTADAAWDREAFVVPVWSSGTWQLVWLSQNGYLVTRSLSTPGSSATSPYLLGAGPLTAQTP